MDPITAAAGAEVLNKVMDKPEEVGKGVNHAANGVGDMVNKSAEGIGKGVESSKNGDAAVIAARGEAEAKRIAAEHNGKAEELRAKGELAEKLAKLDPEVQKELVKQGIFEVTAAKPSKEEISPLMQAAVNTIARPGTTVFNPVLGNPLVSSVQQQMGIN